MFRPTTATVSNEQVLETEASDWTFGDETRQTIRGSALRLVPLTGAVLPTDLAWPKITWDQTDELISLPGDIASRWDVSFNNQPVVSPQTFEFEPLSNFLDIDTEAGEYQRIYQVAGGTADKKYWADHVSNADGWVVQTRLQVLEDPTGLAGDLSHYLVLDDGTHRERIFFHLTGLAFEQNPSLNIYADMRSRPREIRVVGHQDDIFVLLDDGLGVAGIDGFTGDSSLKELSFGTTGSTAHYRTIWDYVNQYHGEPIADSQPTVGRIYSTDPETAYSPGYNPQRPVQQWVSAFFETSGDLTGGTTTITVQYVVNGEWIDFGEFQVDEIGWYQILLDNIPTVEDGTDEIRFKIVQVSNTGFAEPPRIETITVLADFVDGALRVSPRWGHRGGGNTVMLEQTEAGRIIMLGNPPDTGLALDSALEQDVGTHIAWSGSTNAWGDSFSEVAPWGSIMDGWTPVPGGGNLSLSSQSIGIQTGSQILVGTAQRVIAEEEGAGISFLGHTGSGLEFYLEIQTGSVTFIHGSASHTFYHDDYWTPKQVSLVFTGSSDLEVLANEENSSWAFGEFTNFVRVPSSVAVGASPSETGNGLAASLHFTPNELPITGGAIISTPGWQLGLKPGGFPYIEVTDGSDSDSLIGEWPIRCHEERNLAWNYRRYLDHTGLQILVDGEVCGDKVTTLDGAVGGDVVANGEVIGRIREVKVYSASIDARDFSRDNGFSEPVFQVENSIPPESANVLILRFWESGGAVADDSGKDHHAYAALKGRLHVFRDRRIYDEYATAFWGNKAIYKVLHTNDFVQTLPQSLYIEGIFYPPTTDANIYKKMNADESVGIRVDLTTDGLVRATVSDGSQSIVLTSTYVFADGKKRALGISFTEDGITLWIDGVSEEETGTVDADLSAATEDAQFGPGLFAYLRQIALRDGELTQDMFDSWRDWSESKWTPTDTVYVGPEAVEAELVKHFSPWRKFVTMPAGDPGYTTISVETNGQVLPGDRPYKYTYGYTRLIPEDRIEGSVASTHSPFRVIPTVPDGSINLAFIQGPDISVARNVSHIDLSYLEAENLSLHGGGEFMVTGADAGEGQVVYTGQADTSDLLISNRSAAYRLTSEPTPLYHRYLVGRKRYYLYQANATDASDVLVIRDGIKLIDRNGKEIRWDDFPWDIAVSSQDAFGDPLPINVFAVTLFTRLPFIPDNSVLVKYTAADSLFNWRLVPNFTEIVNTLPLFALKDETGSLGAEEYALAFRDDGSYNLHIGTTGS